MNPDLLAALIAYMRTNAPLVSAFGDATSNPKFWADYAAIQNFSGDPPVMPYAVFFEPQESKLYETIDYTSNFSDVADGILIMEVYAMTRLGSRQLAEQAAAVINDAPLTFTLGKLIYLRRLGQNQPILVSEGPDGSPTIFKRQMQFRYLYEETVG